VTWHPLVTACHIPEWAPSEIDCRLCKMSDCDTWSSMAEEQIIRLVICCVKHTFQHRDLAANLSANLDISSRLPFLDGRPMGSLSQATSFWTPQNWACKYTRIALQNNRHQNHQSTKWPFFCSTKCSSRPTRGSTLFAARCERGRELADSVPYNQPILP